MIRERSEDSRLVVIDDGSKDSTYAIMQKLSEEMPKFIPLTKPNGGHGATVLYGYRYALDHGADYVFQTDSDGQTRPEEFAQFWEKRADYHMVIGHRKGRQDGFSRVIVTKTLKLVCLLCFHVRVKDANTPFRIMQAEYLEKNLKVIPENYNLPNVVLSVLYAKVPHGAVRGANPTSDTGVADLQLFACLQQAQGCHIVIADKSVRTVLLLKDFLRCGISALLQLLPPFSFRYKTSAADALC